MEREDVIKIKGASSRDLKDCCDLLIKAYYDNFNEAKAHIIEKLNKKELYVLVFNGEIVAIMSYSKDYSHSANYLSDLIVKKRFRRKGLAERLVKKFIQISRQNTPENQRLALSSTDVTNKPSINLHLKCGFKKIGIIKNLHFGKDEIFFGYKLR